MYKSILIGCVCLTLLSCNNENKTDRKNAFSDVPVTKEDSLYKEVMHVHDVAMAKTSELRKAMNSIKLALDSLDKLPAAKQDKNYRQLLKGISEDLNYADFSMNTWMTEFVIDSAKSHPELRIQYLQSEKVKVDKVNDNIFNSLSRADSLVKK
jgi:hypothetical protein